MIRGPDFFVIGAMKSATSTLHDQLADQPGIFMTDPKEPNFFSDEDIWNRGWSWYEGLFRAGADAAIRGESSTHYTKLPTYPEVVARIEAFVPEARFVYVMRDPVDRLVSQFIHEWTEREMDGPIDDAIERYPRLIDYSRYAMQLRPYLETFGPDRVLPVFFEALRRDPQFELERIGRFLGCREKLEWNADLGNRNVSRDRMRRNPGRDRFLDRPLIRHLRRKFVPRRIRESVKDLWRMKERPTLSPAVRVRVEDELDRDLEVLSAWLGLDLRCGSFASVAASAHPDWTKATPGFRS